jgi:hypothetical protein
MIPDNAAKKIEGMCKFRIPGLEGHDRQLVACGERVGISVVAEADEKLVYCFSVGDGEAVM